MNGLNMHITCVTLHYAIKGCQGQRSSLLGQHIGYEEIGIYLIISMRWQPLQ
jgi:hypothetical protein